MAADPDPDFLQHNPPVARRIMVTMGLVGAWAVFIMVYAFLWAPSHSLFQSVVILIGSFVLTAVAIAAMWIRYGTRHGFPS